ncbi:hypothetical protein HMN09_00992100 [Mycena chlorophos]|uniref:Uncharacterized protein n=1 Tax=Mycena chlorophos TaxID=658473 RepID=A0A8H6W1T1_MYCCL|nr:hypothetical protein HMN09_00992100 [Mycena chlorophos]
MHRWLKAHLKTTFPALFIDDALEISIGNGWVPLLHRLCFALTRLDCPVAFGQIKEKFGGLRAYLVGEQAAAYELEGHAELESDLVCEQCGEDGRAALDGPGGLWLLTLCVDCLDAGSTDGRQRVWDVGEDSA